MMLLFASECYFPESKSILGFLSGTEWLLWLLVSTSPAMPSLHSQTCSRGLNCGSHPDLGWGDRTGTLTDSYLSSRTPQQVGAYFYSWTALPFRENYPCARLQWGPEAIQIQHEQGPLPWKVLGSYSNPFTDRHKEVIGTGSKERT